MKSALTATQAATWRTTPQTAQYYIAVHSPQIIAEGKLQAVPTTYPGNSLSVTNLVGGYNLTNIKRGMTLWVGQEGARYDLGTIRVRKDYVGSSLIEVAEYGSGLLNFGSAASLTVVEDYRIWPIHPSYDTASSRWRFDLDPYTAQTKSYGPQVIMGPPSVGIMDGGKMLASYVGDLSLQHSGSITSQLWTFPNGQTVSSALGSSQNPIVITYTDASPKGAYATLKVTDSNGNSHIGQRLVFCFGTSGVYQPIDCQFEQITGGYKAGGYRTRVSVGENAPSSVWPDGAKVILFEKASYGTAGSSVGGNYFGRDNVVLVGRIVTESQRVEPFTNQITFEIETEDGEMRRSQSYDIFIESGSAASDWSMASGLTLDRAGLVLTKYRSTIANVVDFNPASGIAATNEIPYRDLAQGSLWDQMTYNYQAAGFGMVSFDLQGNLYAMLDTQVTGTSSTLPTVLGIQRGDRQDQVQIDHEHRDTNAQYLIYAIEGGDYNPIAAWSPGDRSGYFGQRQEVSRNLMAPSQDTLITWTGNKRAQDNNPYKRISIPLVGNKRIDPVPQSLVTMSMSAVDNSRNITWKAQKLIPYEININYNAAQAYTSVELVAETVVNGIGGSAFTYPTTTTAPPPPPPHRDCPPGQHWDDATQSCVTDSGGIGDGETVYVCTETFLARTRNFKTGPNWTNLTTITPDGTIVAFILDPFDPGNVGYVLTTTTLYRLTNLNTNTPTWTVRVLATQIDGIDDGFGGGFTTVGTTFETMTSPIGQQNIIWLGWYAGTNRAGQRQVAGVTWGRVDEIIDPMIDPYAVVKESLVTDVNTGGTTVTTSIRRLVQDFTDPSKVYVLGWRHYTGLGGTYEDGAFHHVRVDPSTFGILADSGNWPTDAYSATVFDMDMGYPDSNGTTAMIGFGGSQWHTFTSLDYGRTASDVYLGIGPLGAVGPNLHSGGWRYLVNIATQDVNDILVATIPGDLEATSTIWRSKDHGVTWSAIFSGPIGVNPSLTALGRWPYNPDIIYFLGDFGIYYSETGLTTAPANKLGDFNSAVGTWTKPIMIVPVWVAL